MNIKTIDDSAIFSDELSAGKLPKYESTTVPSQTADIAETPHTKKRYELRKWGSNSLNKDPQRRDRIISHIIDTYERFHEYKKTRAKPTHRFISESEWMDLKNAFPQCCEPCTKTISQYKPRGTAVIHSVPGDHVNTYRNEISALMGGYTELLDKNGDVYCNQCNARHSAKDGDCSFIYLDDGNIQSVKPAQGEKQLAHFHGITIVNASVADLAHAWFTDFHNQPLNQVVMLCGGVTESILDGYTVNEINNTWHMLIRDVINTNRRNQLIFGKPLKVPCMVPTGPEDSRVFSSLAEERRIAIVALTTISNTLNANHRSIIDKNTTRTPLIYRVDEFLDLNDVIQSPNSLEYRANNGFHQCTREQQRNLDCYARMTNYRSLEKWIYDSLTMPAEASLTAKDESKNPVPPRTSTHAQIGIKPDVKLSELAINHHAQCYSRECINHFIVRVRQQCPTKTQQEIADRKELLAHKNTSYCRLTINELYADIKPKYAHLDNIDKRIYEQDRTLKEYEKISPYQKDVNTNDIQIKSIHEQHVAGFTMAHKDPFKGRKTKRGYVIDPITKQEVIQIKSCVATTKLLNLDDNHHIHDDISNRIAEEARRNASLGKRLQGLNEKFAEDKSQDTSTDSAEIRDTDSRYPRDIDTRRQPPRTYKAHRVEKNRQERDERDERTARDEYHKSEYRDDRSRSRHGHRESTKDSGRDKRDTGHRTKSDQPAQSRLIPRQSSSKEGTSKRIRSPEHRSSETEKQLKRTKVNFKDDEIEASKQRLGLLANEVVRIKEAYETEKKNMAQIAKRTKQQEKEEEKKRIFYRKQSDKTYGVIGNLKLSLHWKYGQLTSINLDRIDSAKIKITWTKDGLTEFEKMLSNNQIEQNIDYVGLDRNNKYHDQLFLREVHDNITGRPNLEPVNTFTVQHGHMKVTIDREIHEKVINKQVWCKQNQLNIAKIKNYLNNDRFTDITNDKEEIANKISTSFKMWEDKANEIDKVNIGKKTDVSDRPQIDWIKNASNTLSTRDSLLNDLTLDYEHFLNNVRNAGTLQGKTVDEMLDTIKLNYQAKRDWEIKQEEIATPAPDYVEVLMDLGCKPHEIKTNLKMALQTKSSSKITYGQKLIPVTIIEDGVEKEVIAKQNVEIITLDCSDNEDTPNELPPTNTDMETDNIPSIKPVEIEKQQEEAAITDPIVDDLNSSVKQCSIQTEHEKTPATNEKMDTTELLPTEDTEMKESTTRPKQNADMLHATTPMPIKKEKGIKKEKESSDSDSEEANSSDEIFQKAITNDKWGMDIQQQINEAMASNEMPAQMDSRFIKKANKVSTDSPKKDFEKSKNEQDDDSPNKKEIDSGDISLDDEDFNNLIKEAEDNKKQDEVSEETRAKLAEEQRAQTEKLEKLKKYTNKNPSKADKKKAKDKEKREEAKAQKQLERDREKQDKKSEKPATPSKVTSRKNSADTPKTSRSGKTNSPK